MSRIIRFSHSGSTSNEVTGREVRHARIAREAAAHSFVLLKNNGILPLKQGQRIGLFGAGAAVTIKGGTGSGDVNARSVVSIWEGMKNASFPISSEAYLTDYLGRYEAARQAWKDQILSEAEAAGGRDGMNAFEIYSSHPFSMPAGRQIVPEDLSGTDVALYVISRVAGEGADRRAAEGDYYLSREELADIDALCAMTEHVVLLINTGGQIQLTEVAERKQVAAILLIGQPGQEAGNAVADVLSGKVTPSGKLTNTWARTYEDLPNAATFGSANGNLEKEYYEDGIYVGYRYFDSFGIAPLYPFGYGLSYTTFTVSAQDAQKTRENQETWETQEIRVAQNAPHTGSGVVTLDPFRTGHELTVRVRVQNTGTQFSGREVVQVYARCPQTDIPKEYQKLIGFAKTEELSPGEAEDLSLGIPLRALACFDEAAAAWVLEEGTYGIGIGTSGRDVSIEGLIEVTERIVLEETAHICPLQEPLTEIAPLQAQREEAYQAWLTEAKGRKIPVLQLAVKDLKYQDPRITPEERPLDRTMAEGTAWQTPAEDPLDPIDARAKALVKDMTPQQMAAMLYGEISKSQNTVGSSGIRVPGSAAETSAAFEKHDGIAPVVLADGPAGLRLTQTYQVDPDTDAAYPLDLLESIGGGYFDRGITHEGASTFYQNCTAFPVGSVLAQSWDETVMRRVGAAVAEEMQEFHVSWWLAPGMNIHRNPLCGRNFEYYSEDPVLSGIMAAAMTDGVQSAGGTGTTIKHFACNNQEDNRMGVDAIISERTLREIYLKGFEIAVKHAQPMAIMTSYNLVNGVHTPNSYDLCTQAARTEWGFAGIIMTDWTTTFPHGGSSSWQCAVAGNDVIMPGYEGDVKDIEAAIADGRISDEALRGCMERMVNVILRTNAYEGAQSYTERFPQITPYQVRI